MVDVRGDTGEIEGQAMSEFLEDQAQAYGSVDDVEIEGDDDEVEEGAAKTGRRLGSDEVLAELEKVNPAAAENYRDMQRQMSKGFNTVNTLQETVRQLQERIDGIGNGDGEEEEAETPELPEGITEEGLQQFLQLAKAVGLLSSDDLEERDRGNAANDRASQALRQGVEEFGSDFGTVDDEGNIVLNPDTKARLDARLELLTDPSKGITPYDLFRLEFPDAGVRRSDGENQTRKALARKSNQSETVRRTLPSRSKLKIRKGDSSNEDPEDVFNRAWAASKRNLTE